MSIYSIHSAKRSILFWGSTLGYTSKLFLQSILGIFPFFFIFACTPSPSSSKSPKPSTSLSSAALASPKPTTKRTSPPLTQTKRAPSSSVQNQAQAKLKSHFPSLQASFSLNWSFFKEYWIGWGVDQTQWIFILTPFNRKTQDKASHFVVHTLPLAQDCQTTSECDHWKLKFNVPQSCNTPLIGLEYRSLFPKDTGSKVTLTLVAPFTLFQKDQSHALKIKKAQPNPLRSIWQGDTRFEQTPTAHSESLFKRTRFITQKQAEILSEMDLNAYLKDPQSSSLGLECKPLFTLSRQSARSFNRVDAREKEFDGLEEEVQLFLFKQNQYTAIELEDEIKIRPF